jgi:hypothetical protein
MSITRARLVEVVERLDLNLEIIQSGGGVRVAIAPPKKVDAMTEKEGLTTEDPQEHS